MNHFLELRNISGIYKIANYANGKFYIGSSKNIGKRLYDHVIGLINNYHPNRKLQNAWNKYGEDSFEFSVLEICDISILLEREQYYIDNLVPAYNINPKSTSPLGKRLTKSHKRKISKASKAMWSDPEMRDKILQSTRTDEARERAKNSALDMWKRGEYRTRHSESLYGKGNSKLSPDDVREIRRLHDLGIGSPTLCKMFRLSSTRSIFRILTGITYRWVD